MPEIIKLLGTKILIEETKNGEIKPSLKMVQVVLVKCNLVDKKIEFPFVNGRRILSAKYNNGSKT